MQELNTLQPGDTYGDGRYKVWKRDEDSITVIRQSDKHVIVFRSGLVNWNWKVKKD